MSISTYTQLKSAVAEWLDRTDLTTRIPDFISFAGTDIQHKVRHWRMEQRDTATLDSQYSAVPAGFLEAIRVSITSGTTHELTRVGQSEMLEMRAKGANGTGKPRYYAMTAGEIEVYPTPDGNYTMELVYYGTLDALSDVTTTNWVLTYHPEAYLYGALSRAEPYLKNDERIGTWKSLYAEAISTINSDGEKSKYGSTGLRMKARSF